MVDSLSVSMSLKHRIRADQMAALPDEVKEARQSRMRNRAWKRERQRQNILWWKQVQAARDAAARQVQTDPGNVIPSDDYLVVR